MFELDQLNANFTLFSNYYRMLLSCLVILIKYCINTLNKTHLIIIRFVFSTRSARCCVTPFFKPNDHLLLIYCRYIYDSRKRNRASSFTRFFPPFPISRPAYRRSGGTRFRSVFYGAIKRGAGVRAQNERPYIL